MLSVCEPELILFYESNRRHGLPVDGFGEIAGAQGCALCGLDKVFSVSTGAHRDDFRHPNLPLIINV